MNSLKSIRLAFSSDAVFFKRNDAIQSDNTTIKVCKTSMDIQKLRSCEINIRVRLIKLMGMV